MKANVRSGKLKRGYWRKAYQLYAMLLLPVVFFLVFKYYPIYYAQVAFRDYNIFIPISQSPWNDLAYFKEAFMQPQFLRALSNTLVLNGLDLIFNFPFQIVLALLINEVAFKRLKKLTQSVIYFPYFLSWVIIAGLVLQLFSTRGIVNAALQALSIPPVPFLKEPNSWMVMYIATGAWQSAGYGTIIYLAAMSGIDPTLYEAGYVDGIGRLQKIRYITLPSIKSTIVMMLILQSGRLISISFDRPYMMGNALVMNVSDVISTYVHRFGLQGGRFGYTTAIGLFQSLASFLILFTVNKLAKKIGEEGIM